MGRCLLRSGGGWRGYAKATGRCRAIHRLRHMSTFVFTLKAPRPTFALHMTDDEREIMGRTFAAGDPVVTTGTAYLEVGKMLAGFVRPR
jgi:hypothetical protein